MKIPPFPLKIFVNTINEKYEFFLFSIALGINFYFLLVGFTSNVSDLHGFRQTFTLIPAYYYLTEGLSLNYITPVLGAPWSIPTEFPIYQVLVFLISKLTGLEVIFAGRLISICSFYISLLLLYKILRNLALRPKQIFLILSIVLLTPMYIFWSRTTLIEPLSLASSLAFLYFFLKAQMEFPRMRSFIIAIFFAILSANIKISTFIVALIPAISTYFYFTFLKQPSGILLNSLRSLATTGIIIIPIIIYIIWVGYTDHLKENNPLA